MFSRYFHLFFQVKGQGTLDRLPPSNLSCFSTSAKRCNKPTLELLIWENKNEMVFPIDLLSDQH